MTRQDVFGHKVLVADDDPGILELASRAMARQGIVATCTSNGDSALYHLRQTKFIALVTDLRMPKLNGHELVKRVLKEKLAPIIIVVTGVHEPRLVEDLLARGVTSVEAKPLDFSLLAATVRGYAERWLELESESPITPSPLGLAFSPNPPPAESTQYELSQIVKSLGEEKEQAERGLFEVLKIFSHIMSQTGHFSGSHATRVENISSYVAQKIHLTQANTKNLKLAALMHDLGQFGMPGEITSKPPHLMSAEELQIFSTYPKLGALLLEHTDTGRPVAQIVMAHRENYDGSGFENRLAGEDIPIEARILRIADSVDNALSHPEGEPKEFTLRMLEKFAGKKYDPSLVGFAQEFVQTHYRDGGRVGKPIPALALQPGMVLAENVYDNRGQFMAKEGTELTNRLIGRFAMALSQNSINVYLNARDLEANWSNE